jgi:hypothetical protein
MFAWGKIHFFLYDPTWNPKKRFFVNKPSSLEELSPKTMDNQQRLSMAAEVKQATPGTVQKSLVPKDMYGRVLYFV